MAPRGGLSSDLYELLGLSPCATVKEIKRAFHKKALQCHPDKNPNGEALFKQIANAYQILLDPKKRAEYDLTRPNSNNPAPPTYERRGHQGNRRSAHVPKESLNVAEIIRKDKEMQKKKDDLKKQCGFDPSVDVNFQDLLRRFAEELHNHPPSSKRSRRTFNTRKPSTARPQTDQEKPAPPTTEGTENVPKPPPKRNEVNPNEKPDDTKHQDNPFKRYSNKNTEAFDMKFKRKENDDVENDKEKYDNQNNLNNQNYQNYQNNQSNDEKTYPTTMHSLKQRIEHQRIQRELDIRIQKIKTEQQHLEELRQKEIEREQEEYKRLEDEKIRQMEQLRKLQTSPPIRIAPLELSDTAKEFIRHIRKQRTRDF